MAIKNDERVRPTDDTSGGSNGDRGLNVMEPSINVGSGRDV